MRILFVCLGNICRSPMAEFVMRKMVKDAGLSDRFLIASAATSVEEIGNPVYPPAKRTLAQHGIDCTGKTARQMTRADYEYFDAIIALERANLPAIQRIIGSDDQHKVSLLLDHTDHPHDIADPWYTGNFDITWDEVNEGCAALLSEYASRV